MSAKNAHTNIHSKRSNNEGCIRRRSDGRWEAIYIAEYTLDGRPVRRSVYGKTRPDVTLKLRDILQQLSMQEYVPPQKITVGEWLDEWWRIYCLPSKKISTCTGYESTINLHIRPYLGRIELQDLKPMQIQAAINQLVKEGKAPSTVRKAQTLLHCALEQAIINGMLIRNPSERTILPKMEQQEIRYFTLEEQRRFIAALPDSTAGRALYFILGTGIRAAELTGLRWSDIQSNQFTVAQTIRRNRDFSDNAKFRTSLQTSTPKTRAGRRVIPLPPKMRELLQIQRKKQLEARMAAGPGWNSNDLVFCSEIGTPYEGRNLTRVLHRTLKRIGIETLGVHSLRHSFATRALESGMDLRTLSEILGHAKVSLTLQLYAHSTLETKRSVMEKMDVFL